MPLFIITKYENKTEWKKQRIGRKEIKEEREGGKEGVLQED